MAHIRKYRDIESELAILSRNTVRGEFRGILMNSDGSIAHDTGWFDNLILNIGLTQLGQQSSPFGAGHIGSSATSPDVTQTALQGWLGSSQVNNGEGDVGVNDGPSTYRLHTLRNRRFAAGVGTGTIREFGFGYSTGNTNLTCRALVSPEFVKGATQVLDVYYRFYMYPSLSDTTGQITISGVTYDFTSRAMDIDNSTSVQTMVQYHPFVSGSAHFAWSGNIGSLTSTPTGSSYNTGAVPSITAYGQGYIDYYLFWDLNYGNDAGGIRSVSTRFYQSGGCGAQIQYANAVGGATIPKDNTKTLLLNMRRTWARHV